MPDILIAEDEDMLRNNLAYIINGHGYDAIGVKTGRQAMDLLKKRRFDVLITDIMMPEVSGSELIKFVSKEHPETAIMVITAYPSAESAIESIKHGVYDYFTKPFRTEEVVKAVRRAVERKKPVPFVWESLSAFGITNRERSMLELMLIRGITGTQEIADNLSIKPTTVKQHLENLYGKFGVANRASLISAVVKALRVAK